MVIVATLYGHVKPYNYQRIGFVQVKLNTDLFTCIKFHRDPTVKIHNCRRRGRVNEFQIKLYVRVRTIHKTVGNCVYGY